MKSEKREKCEVPSADFWKSLADKMSGSSVNRKCMTAECWDRAADGYDDLDQCRDYINQVESVVSILKDSGLLNKETHVIDIACGTGTYAVRMAPFCRSVTCLDISGRMLEKLREKKQLAGLDNIELIHGDWHEFSTDRKFDLVFCSMSPLLRTMDNVDRFFEYSCRHVAFVTWAGIRENTILMELGARLLGRRPGSHTSDMNVIFNYLYALGYAPELRFFRGCWEKSRSVEKQIKNLIWRLEMYRPLDDVEKDFIRSYVMERSENGMMTVTTKVRTVLMMVDKEAERFSCETDHHT